MQNEEENQIDPKAAASLWTAIRHRRSMGLSRLKPDAVDRSLIEQMLEAANWAPSHGDTEPWRFTIFMGDGRERLADLFEAAHGQEGARKRAFAAPVWISIGMEPGRQKDGSLLMTVDEELLAVACAVQNLHLMASALGLAGMWHSKGGSVDPVVAHGLGLDSPARLLGFFMCGWPSTDWLTSIRRPLAEKVRWVERADTEPL
jgi:nitroreductase